MTSLYGRFIPIVFIFILLFSIADILTSYINLNTVKTDERLVDHTTQVREELCNALLALVDAETGQRGFLITGDDKYLDPDKHAVSMINIHLDRLKQLIRDDRNQQKH